GSTSGSDYATVAYDASTGTQLWVKRYNGAANRGEISAALAVSPDGGKVFVTGSSDGSTSGSDYATVAYDASTGARLWVKRYDGPAKGADYSLDLGVAPNGSAVFVTGYSDGLASSTSPQDYATVAYDASSGAQIWAKRYDGPGHRGDSGFALAVGPGGGRVFVTGRSYGSSTTGYDYATVAYNAATGMRLWVRRYDGPGSGPGGDTARDVGVSPNGSTVFMTGDSLGSTGSADYATVAYSTSTGATHWVKRYSGPGNRNDLAFALGVSLDGSALFVTGYSWASTTSSYDYATLAYGASEGASRWARRYNGPTNGDDFAGALGVSPDGSRLFVTGGSPGSTTSGQDFATLAYSVP
ncbi:MAG: PQQ-binding-like beta-propeller repeat protein, partial [Solirubrobacterales bacterium]